MDRNSNTNTLRVNNNSNNNTVINSNSVNNNMNNNLPLNSSNNAINSNINGLNIIKNNINKSHSNKDKSEPSLKNHNKHVVNSQTNHKSSKASIQSLHTRQHSIQQQLTTTQNSNSDSNPSVNQVMDRTPCGSATMTPHYDESSDARVTPPHLLWAQDFDYLFNDKEGRDLFIRYLENEGLDILMEFWFACEGFKGETLNEEKDKEEKEREKDKEEMDKEEKAREEYMKRIRKMIRLINKRYIKGSKIIIDILSDEVKGCITEGLHKLKADSKTIDRYIFDAAQIEVFDQFRGAIYQNFLNSEFYLHYFQPNDGFIDQSIGAIGGYDNIKDPNESSKCSIETSVDDYSAHNQYYDVLPTLHEDSELQTLNTLNSNTNTRSQSQTKFPADDCHNLMSSGSSDTLMRSLNRIANQRSVSNSSNRTTDDSHPLSPNLNRLSPAYQSYLKSKSMANPPNPYHTKYHSYLPTSAQDSELQSHSSHSTNDSMSCVSGTNGTDNTIRSKKQMNIAIRHNAKLNSNVNNMNQNRDLMVVMQSRTHKPLPASAKDASNPEKFASMLIEKLERIKKERDSQESNDKKLAEVLQAIESNNSNNKSNTNTNSRPTTTNPSDNSNCRTTKSLKEVLCKQKFESVELEDQSILDRHCELVFADTPNETPTDSIGRCVSPPKHNFRAFPPVPAVSSSMSSAINSTFDTMKVLATVLYSNETVPYRVTFTGPHITLRKFKQQIPLKRGNWQYFFKRTCDETDISATFLLEKITDDNALLPLIDGKIFAELQESSNSSNN